MILMVPFQLEIFCDSVFHRKGTACIICGLTHQENDETFPFQAIRKEIDKNYCSTPSGEGEGNGGKGLVHAFLGSTLKQPLEYTTNTTQILAQKPFYYE